MALAIRPELWFSRSQMSRSQLALCNRMRFEVCAFDPVIRFIFSEQLFEVMAIFSRHMFNLALRIILIPLIPILDANVCKADPPQLIGGFIERCHFQGHA